MKMERPAALARWLERGDLQWYDNGQVSLRGDALELYRRIDRLFVEWAARDHGAGDEVFPTFLPAAELAKIDYLRSFPHLVTLPLTLSPDPAAIRAFLAEGPQLPDGEVRLPPAAPIRDVLTPAACYHFYIRHADRTIAAPTFLTTRATCYRREAHYEPLTRMWSFSLREVVCLGPSETVQAFLDGFLEKLVELARQIGLPVRFDTASDPFFDPTRNPRWIAQVVAPVKREMLFEDCAIGSLNFHRTYFGEAFGMRYEDGPVSSGCVGFGIERWMYAILATFGEKPCDWPV